MNRLDQPDNFLEWIDWHDDEGKVENAVYLSFSEAFDTVSNNFLKDRPIKYKLGKWMIEWTERSETCLICCRQLTT